MGCPVQSRTELHVRLINWKLVNDTFWSMHTQLGWINRGESFGVEVHHQSSATLVNLGSACLNCFKNRIISSAYLLGISFLTYCLWFRDKGCDRYSRYIPPALQIYLAEKKPDTSASESAASIRKSWSYSEARIELANEYIYIHVAFSVSISIIMVFTRDFWNFENVLYRMSMDLPTDNN